MSGSDPIHGSLGPPKRPPYEPSADEKVEADLRSRKPIKYKYEDETVHDTEKSIAIAEKLVKGKMQEPHDVIKAEMKKSKANPLVKYPVYDSDDEDPDTVETRKSLKTAEKMLKARFFTNESDRKKYAEMDKKGTLREEVKEFKEKEKDDDILKNDEEKEKKEEDKKEEKAKKKV